MSTTEMKSCNTRFRRGGLIFLLIYLIIGLAGLATRNQEIFPFFSWFLFPFTPQMGQIEYNLRLCEVKGVYVEGEPFYKDAPSPEFVDNPQSPEAWLIVQNLGKAFMEGNSKRVEELRKLLEVSYIPNVTEYKLVKVGYNPILRYKKDPLTFREHQLVSFRRLDSKDKKDSQ